jgi:hypothetical protein
MYRHSGYSLSGLLEEAEKRDARITIPIAARVLPNAPVARRTD